MFMTTTLAHYQIPIWGVGSSALETRIGADQRSVWMRPITSGAAQTEMPPATTVRATDRVTTPMAYAQWLHMLTRYQAGTAPDGTGAGADRPATPARPATP